MSTLIKSGRIITATRDLIADIFIEGEIIIEIGEGLKREADRIIDASGKMIFPGGIDPHVHLDLPVMGTHSSDDFETGTRAALFGGTTTIIDFANQSKGESLYTALNTWKEKAGNKACCDYSFHISITDFNEKTRVEIKDLIQKDGITSFKTFMAYKDTLMIDDDQMMAIMEVVKEYGGLVSVHATDGNMIDTNVKKFKAEKKLSPWYHYLSQPEITEATATKRFVDMAVQSGVKAYVVHMTCEGALKSVTETKSAENVLVETCPQYLLLDHSLYKKEDAIKWVMSPPLRQEKDRKILWDGIKNGVVKVVGTDHCPFMLKDKEKGIDDFTKIPNGAPGIEHRIELLFSEGVLKDRISLNRFVEVTSTNAARIFGLYPQKGDIKVGSDADIIIFDPNEKHIISAKTHHHHCDYSAYEGWEVTGRTESVFLRGKLAVENGQCYIIRGEGQHLKRSIPEMPNRN